MSVNSDSEVEIIAENLDTLDLDSEELQLEVELLRQKPYLHLRKPRFNFNKMTENQASGQSSASTALVQNEVPRNEVQLLLQAIPEYSPGQNLSILINEVDNLTQHLNKRLTADLVYVVNFNIRSKIKGDARDYISHQNATEWHEIRAALLQKYGDQRSEDLLTSSLTQCVQLRNESYMDYYGRLLKAFNDLMQTKQKIVVEIDRKLSDPFQIDIGTPQGSVLGSLLFLVLINDLPDYITQGEVFLYADDTTVV